MSTSRTYTSLQALTASQMNDLAQGTIGYAQVTANQGSITAVVDLTGLTVTVTLVAGRRIRITGCAQFANTTAGDGVLFNIQEGATTLMTAVAAHPLANTTITVTPTVIIQPSAGSHTYKLTAQTQTGGTATLTAAATSPAYIHVEDIGI